MCEDNSLGTGNGSEERWGMGYLEADDRVDSATKGGGNSMGGKSEGAEEGREGEEEGCGRSSLTTTHVRTHDRLMPFDYRGGGKRARGGKREREERREGGGEEREERRERRGEREERRGVTKKMVHKPTHCIVVNYLDNKYSSKYSPPLHHGTHTLRASVLLPSSRQQMSTVA